MAAAEKFLFDTCFDKPDPRADVQAAPAAPTFTEQDMEEAKRAAFDAGVAEGRARAGQERESLVASALTRIDAEMTRLHENLATILSQTECKAVEAAVTLVRKLLPGLARGRDMTEIEALIENSLRSLLDEPRVVVRVPDSLLDPLKEQIAAIAERSGFAGRVVLVVDRSLGASDCRVEWADGGVERDTARVWAEAEKALARFNNASPAAEGTPADGNEAAAQSPTDGTE
jgi:flagellar assembly protein FliH